MINDEIVKTSLDGLNKSVITYDDPSDFSHLQDYVGEDIILKARVDHFHYDNDSGTKFIILSDGSQEFPAIIFESTKVSYIDVGDTYEFRDYVQYTSDGEDIEFIILGME